LKAALSFKIFQRATQHFVATYRLRNSGPRPLRERDHWGDPDADGSIILRWIFRKWEGVVRTG